MEENEVLNGLSSHQAVLTGKHFVYTSGAHGSAYINMREAAHDARFMRAIGQEMAHQLEDLNPEIILGPETLGRTLAGYVAAKLGIPAIWCDMVELNPDTHEKLAVFSDKLNFSRLLPGKRVAIVDDLLTTGSSLMAASRAAMAEGADVIGAACAVRRTPDVGAHECGVPELKVLAEIQGFGVLTLGECASIGPCSRNEPIVLRPGHGWKYQQKHPDYPGGYVSL